MDRLSNRVHGLWSGFTAIVPDFKAFIPVIGQIPDECTGLGPDAIPAVRGEGSSL